MKKIWLLFRLKIVKFICPEIFEAILNNKIEQNKRQLENRNFINFG